MNDGGSSPLARGTHNIALAKCRRCRLIPARAGNTKHFPVQYPRCAAHPRSRGEHEFNTEGMLRGDGSSPLARGTHEGDFGGGAALRLIPARAGNTNSIPKGCYAATAHPRSRGEHMRVTSAVVRRFGSSPLARGTRIQYRRDATRRRLIPARAGNTTMLMMISCTTAAHPRSRGEHLDLAVLRAEVAGSSPLARGTPRLSGVTCGGCRLIPARAGNTLCRFVAVERYQAHPRSRGEHTSESGPSSSGFGSSPLARGTPPG